MSQRIKLVQGDNRPYVRLTLRQSDGTTMNLSDATAVVYFRAAGASTVLATLPCTKINGGVNGEIVFNFPGNALNVAPGEYEGEVEVDFSGEKQTVYEILKFSVRAQFN